MNYHDCSFDLSHGYRNSKEAKTGIAKREVVGVIGWSGETRILAELVETQWALLDSNWSLQLDKRSEEDGHILKLRGNHLVCMLLSQFPTHVQFKPSFY